MNARYRFDCVRETATPCKVSELPSVRDHRDVAKHSQCDLSDMREQFRVMILDTKNRIREDRLIALGTLNSCVVHPREILKPAILASAASIIIYHNHPSGDPQPSREDMEFSRRLSKACELIGIELLDSIVVAERGSVSLRAQGLI